jgi:hypothetical protein
VLDPNMVVGEVPTVEQPAALPALGIAIVPSGLTPGDAISVAPSPIPVGETAGLDALPSGDVAPMAGVGVGMAATCATAAWQTRSAGSSA